VVSCRSAGQDVFIRADEADSTDRTGIYKMRSAFQDWKRMASIRGNRAAPNNEFDLTTAKAGCRSTQCWMDSLAG